MRAILTFVALTTKSSPRPTKPAVAAVACSVVHLRTGVLGVAGVAASLISAKPNSTPPRLRPVAPAFSTPPV